MERLTKWNADKECFEWVSDISDEDKLDRVAAFEESGYTPERCAELGEAEKEGRVIPCGVDEFWRDKEINSRVIRVTGATLTRDGLFVTYRLRGYREQYSCQAAVFEENYTRRAEAAEKALLEREEGE